MPFIILLLFSALAVSSVAAYFSIVGLITIFPAASTEIMTMGIALEIAKLVTAAWLYRYWSTSNTLIKTYFTAAVVVLSIITSLGIFGFLSRAHIDQTATNQDYTLNMEVIEFRLDAEVSKLQQARQRIEGLDDTLRTSRGEDKNYVNRQQREERGELNAQMDAAVARIDELNLELLPMKQEVANMNAELGPIKYIAELIYQDSVAANVDKSVRIIIMLLIFVFDPLAILLVIAANMSLMQRRGESITFIGEKDLEKPEQDFGVKAEEQPTTPEPFDEESDNWVSEKYGKESKMDSVKESRLKWLIDNKTQSE